MKKRWTIRLTGLVLFLLAIGLVAGTAARAQEEEEEGRKAQQAADALKKVVEAGSKLFRDASLGTKERACAKCHEDPEKEHLNLATRANSFPKWDRRERKVINLPQKVNQMIDRMLGGKPLELGSEQMVAIEAYLMSISRKKE